jgi:hypothetical protein
VNDVPPKRPTVDGGELRLPDGRSLPLDTLAWDGWLAQALAFDVAHPAGEYLVAREKRQRGGLYWVARRYDRGRRASVYLGARITAAVLARTGMDLAAKIDAQPLAEPKSRQRQRVRSAPQLDTLAGESNPTTMRAVVAELLAQEVDPSRRAALEALHRLVESVWPERK